ncbi:MAG TPA: acetoin utilization protein AcuC [Terriglobales bacterium]|nr:acetoin utilization protein AcuC [Terriglobales bacterium]
MSGTVSLIWGDALMAYRLSEDHPLQPLRVKLTVDLIRELGLDAGVEVVEPRLATDAEIALCHSPRYVALVRLLSQGAPVDQGAAEAGFGSLDNPVAPGMHEACAAVVGASLVAAEAVHSGASLHAFTPAGGLHHAMRARASGFCVYNDVAVAVAWLRARGHRVAYVDVDVHHGDGTQALFYGDPDVLTISLHESGRYLFPGTGFPDETGVGAARGTSANLPLAPYTWDEPWLAAFEATVPPLLRAFRPTVLVTQDGCDTHALDPLAHLLGSTAIWPRVGRRFHELAHELCEGRWLATGGGGYAVREVVPRAWTLLFAEMVERPEAAASLIDSERYAPEAAAQERVWTLLERDLGSLARELETEISLARS